MVSEKEPIILALDGMGGDHAPASVIEGAERALNKMPDYNLEFLIFGNRNKINYHLSKRKNLKERTKVIHTTDFIRDDEKPSVALRQGKDSSMRMAINAVKEGQAHGVVSAGNTGALMAMSKIVFRSLPGIDRPAIVSLMPSTHGKVVMLDLGANVDCTAEQLFQFAVMGDAFARVELCLDNPRIGLLNIGSEELKGTDSIREAAELLRNTDLPLNYTGFVEADDIPFGAVDVVVSDGFVGNVALKMAEGTARFCGQYFKTGLKSSFITKAAAFIAKKRLKTTMKKLDPRHYNGAMFVGLNGITIKSHGGADKKAFSRAIKVAISAIDKDINGRIIAEMQAFHKQLEKTQKSKEAKEKAS